ncbi:hypothetical protein, partial [Streptococcus pneumoniae]
MLACLSTGALAVAAPLTDGTAPTAATVGTLGVTVSVTGTPDATLGEGPPFVVTVTCRAPEGTVA